MKLSAKISIQHIVMALAELGLKEVVVCPGSRNAPLVMSFNRHPAFHCTSIRDERSAGFFALGKAIGLKQAVAVVCTSGSAALNFAPAVSEAFYQRIPLIVITADRPKEWTGQGDGQTINQTNMYENFIRRSYDLNGDISTPSVLWYNDRCLSEGFNIATISDKGPVHFNVPVSEPLYETAEVTGLKPRIFRLETTEKILSAESLSRMWGQFSACKKVMIIVGQHSADDLPAKELSKIGHFRNVIVLTESIANMHDESFVENIDRCITNLENEDALALMPELLITMGGAIISKRIKALIRKYRPQFHWNVTPFDTDMDTYQSLTLAVPVEPSVFIKQLLQVASDVPSGYHEKWIRRKDQLAKLHERFCATCNYSDLKVFYRLYQTIPSNIFLHMANSSPVRYAQLFDNGSIADSWSNRGTSGIDGCVSTAMGAASALPEKNFLLITGDVAFHYDKNALWNDEAINNLNIIIINNGGGGIFRIISGTDKVDEMEKYFETSMEITAEKIAEHYHWNYLPVKAEEQLNDILKSFFNGRTGRTILEIFTNAETNPIVLEGYWRYLKEKSEAV